MTHRAATIIAISMMTASDSVAAMRPKWGTAHSSRIGPKDPPDRKDEYEIDHA
jgi:hypothetical protein